MIKYQWRAHNVDGHAYKLASHGKGLALICTADYETVRAREPQELQTVIEAGIEAVQQIVNHWQGGDLAEAVNEAEDWAVQAGDYVGDDIEAEDGCSVDVSLAAFSDWDDLSAFAQDVGALLECGPETIIRSMSC